MSSLRCRHDTRSSPPSHQRSISGSPTHHEFVSGPNAFFNKHSQTESAVDGRFTEQLSKLGPCHTLNTLTPPIKELQENIRLQHPSVNSEPRHRVAVGVAQSRYRPLVSGKYIQELKFVPPGSRNGLRAHKSRGRFSTKDSKGDDLLLLIRNGSVNSSNVAQADTRALPPDTPAAASVTNNTSLPCKRLNPSKSCQSFSEEIEPAHPKRSLLDRLALGIPILRPSYFTLSSKERTKTNVCPRGTPPKAARILGAVYEKQHSTSPSKLLRSNLLDPSGLEHNFTDKASITEQSSSVLGKPAISAHQREHTNRAPSERLRHRVEEQVHFPSLKFYSDEMPPTPPRKATPPNRPRPPPLTHRRRCSEPRLPSTHDLTFTTKLHTMSKSNKETSFPVRTKSVTSPVKLDEDSAKTEYILGFPLNTNGISPNNLQNDISNVPMVYYSPSLYQDENTPPMPPPKSPGTCSKNFSRLYPDPLKFSLGAHGPVTSSSGANSHSDSGESIQVFLDQSIRSGQNTASAGFDGSFPHLAPYIPVVHTPLSQIMTNEQEESIEVKGRAPHIQHETASVLAIRELICGLDTKIVAMFREMSKATTFQSTLHKTANEQETIDEQNKFGKLFAGMEGFKNDMLKWFEHLSKGQVVARQSHNTLVETTTALHQTVSELRKDIQALTRVVANFQTHNSYPPLGPSQPFVQQQVQHQQYQLHQPQYQAACVAPSPVYHAYNQYSHVPHTLSYAAPMMAAQTPSIRTSGGNPAISTFAINQNLVPQTDGYEHFKRGDSRHKRAAPVDLIGRKVSHGIRK